MRRKMEGGGGKEKNARFFVLIAPIINKPRNAAVFPLCNGGSGQET